MLSSGAKINLSDISLKSLEVVKKKYTNYSNYRTSIADIENLPFESNAFDIVASAGTLSYGDNKLVLSEIYRVLKNDGKFICVDSLNHNSIYRLNRYLHYLKGKRTYSTLSRIPTFDLIDEYKKYFGTTETYLFGSISWMMPILSKFIDEGLVKNFSDWFDQKVAVQKSAFKFVLIAHKSNRCHE